MLDQQAEGGHGVDADDTIPPRLPGIHPALWKLLVESPLLFSSLILSTFV